VGPRSLLATAAVVVAGLTVFAPRDTEALRQKTLRPVAVQDLILASRVVDIQLSPDGGQLLYEVRRTEFTKNAFRTELWLRDTSSHSERMITQSALTSDPQRSVKGQWAPDGRSVTYISHRDGLFRLWRDWLGHAAPEPLIGTDDPDGPSLSTDEMSSYQWSRDGQYIAVVALPHQGRHQTTDPPVLQRGVTADISWPRPPTAESSALWIVETRTGQVKRCTEASLYVRQATWAPDSKRLAFVASIGRDGYPLTNDLYLYDLLRDSVRPLVNQPGSDSRPSWSPDGKQLAFISQRGNRDWHYTSWLAVVDASGGQPQYFLDDFERESGSVPRDVWWDTDNKSVYVVAGYRFGSHLFRFNISSGQLQQVTPSESSLGTYLSLFRPSTNGRGLAFRAESIATPGDVIVGSLPWGEISQVTDLNRDWRSIAKPRVEAVQWRSRDNQFDIHGLLIEPPHYQKGKRYPTVVFLAGGPSMVRAGFNLDEDVYPHLVLAAKGYVILAPNTRGRSGFGAQFRKAIPDHADYFPGPYEDVISGIDYLVGQGIADPDHLGIMGFSYGAGLTAYAITRTQRFRAAIIDEGFPNNVRVALAAGGDSDTMKRLRDQRGFPPIWDPRGLEILIAQSPLLAFNRVVTPTLLLYGADSLAPTDGVDSLRALREFNVPSQLVVYPRTAHIIGEPQLLADSFCRSLTWFDYWMSGAHAGFSESAYGVEVESCLTGATDHRPTVTANSATR
jgi:dipeptidyl aminopeptidase/acylaminoacyl peptidase